MSTTRSDLENRLSQTTLSTNDKPDITVEPLEEEWSEAGKISLAPESTQLPLPLGGKDSQSADLDSSQQSLVDRPQRLPPTHSQPQAKITATIPHPGKYSPWQHERGREVRRAIAGGAAASSSFMGSTGVAAGIGFAIGSLAGGPFIGGLIGAGVGALVGLYLAKKSADKVESMHEPGDKQRFAQRAQAHDDSMAALKTLKAKHWLTQPIADGWSRLDVDQQRRLMSIDPAVKLSRDEVADIQARVMLRVGQAMNEKGASPDYAMKVALAFKAELEKQVAEDADFTPLPPRVLPSQEQQLNEVPDKLAMSSDELAALPEEDDDWQKLPNLDNNTIPKLKFLVPKSQRELLGSRVTQEYQQAQLRAERNELNEVADRAPMFKDIATGFDAMSKSFASDRMTENFPQKDVNASIWDARSTAMQGLGITAPGNPNETIPASGLTDYDVARFKELALTTAAIRQRHGHPNDAPPLTKKEKAMLQQQLDEAKPWLHNMRKSARVISSYRQAFQQDFQRLSRSPNLKILNETQARLDSIESESRLLERYEDDFVSRSLGPALGPALGGGQQPGPVSVADQANFRNIKRKFPSASDRLNRVNQLKQQRSELLPENVRSRREFKQEVAPMVQRYKDFGFDGDPHHWRRGGGGKQDIDGQRGSTVFSTMQSQTTATLDYVENGLLPELQQKLDEIPADKK